MTATNHALTGAFIGLTIGNPLLAIPLAVASHFLLDALPHFGSKHLQAESKRFIYYLAIEAGMCAAIVVTLIWLQPINFVVAAICAFVATSPDFMWINDFIRAQHRKPVRTSENWLVRLHSHIQWYQKEPGALVELGWALMMVIALAKVIVIW